MPAAQRSYVLALGTSHSAPRVALAALQAIDADAELRARKAERWHYIDWLPPDEPTGPPYRLADPDDPESMEAVLFNAADAMDRRNVELIEELGPSSSPMVEVVSALIVVLGQVAMGGGNEAGKDMYQTAKRVLTTPWRRRSPRRLQTSLERLLAELGLMYSRDETTGPVFLRVLDPPVVFLAEPDLPDYALRHAARIVLGAAPRPPMLDWPLRFSRSTDDWEPLPPSWRQVYSIIALGKELGQERGPR